VPVAIAVAAGGVAALLWFAPRATGTRWGVLLPALGWFVMVWAGVTTRLNGDRLLMPDDWVATLTLFGGTVLMVVGMVLAMTGDRSPAGSPAGYPAGPRAGPRAGPPAGGHPVHDR
jgi:carbon starvation protein CstA